MMQGLRFFLILMLVLTGQTLAAARGQAQIAGEIVLCQGEVARVVTVDAEGKPVKRVTLCPDMATSLMSGLTLDAPALRRADLHRLALPDRRVWLGTGRSAPAFSARDPPEGLLL
ncbi:hypothetical protein [Paracoccus aminophilus]|uniref:Nuclease n=1 Tax=Paracoccus aminophilus JCM 7686 TaxID=1367847 RepID=S5YWY7_PARAH|nr:hypothetical protein [Paracoccus aminophilus]AGT09731.1 hypothetical protein JCM7686_2675 [Paracoccus aminophilus JCM 7686]